MRSSFEIFKHFVERDLKDTIALWTIVILAAAILGIAPLALHEKVLYLFVVLSIFPVLAVQYILGTKFRSQLYLSNYYTHALPVSRSQMFFTIHLRLLIFWLPFLCFMAILIIQMHDFFEIAFNIHLPLVFYLALAGPIYFNNVNFSNAMGRLYFDRSIGHQKMILHMNLVVLKILLEAAIIFSPAFFRENNFLGFFCDFVSPAYLTFSTWKARRDWVNCR